MHPYINRSAKCPWRWYRNAKDRLRHDDQCAPNSGSDPCPYALVFPSNTILPFQIHARPNTGAISSWKLYDLEGVEQYDLADYIDALDTVSLASPLRDVIMLVSPLVLSDTDFPNGTFESVIETANGTYYSETFKTSCGEAGDHLENDTMADLDAPWSYGEWSGRAGGTIGIAGPPSRIGYYAGERVIGLADDLLYTWNGDSWDSSTPADGEYFSLGLGLAWYRFSGGTWTGPVSVPVVPGTSSCYNGIRGVPLLYTVPDDFEGGLVRFDFTLFYGSPFSGDVTVSHNGIPLGTYDDSVNGIGQAFILDLQPGDALLFEPTSDFDGCIMGLSIVSWEDGTECMTLMRWRNCSDIGTLLYGDGYDNWLYLPNIKSFYGVPSPQFKDEKETGERGSEVRIGGRKDVDWTLDLDVLPWYLIDAITEAALADDVRLRVAGADGMDDIADLRFSVDWEQSKCLADASMVFRVDEGDATNPCCDDHQRLCNILGDYTGFALLTFVASTGWLLTLTTTSGYWAIRRDDGTITVTESSVALVIISAGTESVCLWSCDEDGNKAGRVTHVVSRFRGGLLNSNWVGLTHLVRLEIPDHDAHEATNTGTTEMSALAYIDMSGGALTASEVDNVIASTNAAIANGTLKLDGGTMAAPTGGQDAKEAELVANGWTVTTN